MDEILNEIKNSPIMMYQLGQWANLVFSISNHTDEEKKEIEEYNFKNFKWHYKENKEEALMFYPQFKNYIYE